MSVQGEWSEFLAFLSHTFKEKKGDISLNKRNETASRVRSPSVLRGVIRGGRFPALNEGLGTQKNVFE